MGKISSSVTKILPGGPAFSYEHTKIFVEKRGEPGRPGSYEEALSRHWEPSD